MSRVGNNPITIPALVTINIEGNLVTASGPLGNLSTLLRNEVKAEVVDNQILVKRKKNDSFSASLHGLSRSLIANMVQGVEKGWEKRLELIGVGFRAQLNGDKLVLNVGYSHQVEIITPEGISFGVEENTKIVVKGADKNRVGQIAADIRKVRPPEPYQGKGIRYAGERVRRKAGKAGKVGAGAK